MPSARAGGSGTERLASPRPQPRARRRSQAANNRRLCLAQAGVGAGPGSGSAERSGGTSPGQTPHARTHLFCRSRSSHAPARDPRADLLLHAGPEQSPGQRRGQAGAPSPGGAFFSPGAPEPSCPRGPGGRPSWGSLPASPRCLPARAGVAELHCSEPGAGAGRAAPGFSRPGLDGAGARRGPAALAGTWEPTCERRGAAGPGCLRAGCCPLLPRASSAGAGLRACPRPRPSEAHAESRRPRRGEARRGAAGGAGERGATARRPPPRIPELRRRGGPGQDPARRSRSGSCLCPGADGKSREMGSGARVITLPLRGVKQTRLLPPPGSPLPLAGPPCPALPAGGG